jgi:hypothetical protein
MQADADYRGDGGLWRIFDGGAVFVILAVAIVGRSASSISFVSPMMGRSAWVAGTASAEIAETELNYWQKHQ